MSKILEKVEEKMAVLEILMDMQEHINSPEKVQDIISSISLYWAHVPDGDKDYVECAREAMKNGTEWLV
jgi:hypothetical protein